MQRCARVFASALLCSALGACTPDGICTADALTHALASATSGSTVAVGACTIEGAFVVPAGVTLHGAGASSVLASVAGGAPVLDVHGGVGETHVTALALRESHGGAALRSVDGGAVVLEHLDVDVIRGIGVGQSGASLTLEDVTLHGPVTRESAVSAPSDPAETGVWAVVARDAALTFTGVRVRGFAVGGVSVEGGSLDWTDTDDLADIDQSRGTGIALFGADAQLDGVEIGGMLAGIGFAGVAIACALRHPADPPAQVTLVDVQILAGAGYGIAAFDTALHVQGLGVESVGLVGLQAERGTLTASDLTMHGNGGAGVALLDVASISITHAVVSGQRMVSLPTDLGSAPFGDGIHVRRTSVTGPDVDLTLSDVTLDDNPRAGMLLDARGGAPRTLSLVGVSASATEPGALGVIAQQTTLPSGWDADVVRTGTPLANDALFSGEIDVLGVLMPPTSLPPPF